MNDLESSGSQTGAPATYNGPHEEFRELCALATSGELAPAEWERLNRHLAHCQACRRLFGDYTEVAGVALPALAAAEPFGLDGQNSPDSQGWRIEDAEVALMVRLENERGRPGKILGLAKRPLRSMPPWKLAAAALVLVAVGLASFESGRLLGRRSRPSGSLSETRTVPPAPSADRAAPSSFPAGAQDARRTPGIDQDRVAQGELRTLRHRLQQSDEQRSRLAIELGQANLALSQESAALEKSRAGRAVLAQELATAEAQAQSLNVKLAAYGGQSADETREILGLKTRMQDLTEALHDKDRQIAYEQQMLTRDSDIRNVIGARNLYIAEIYDVAKNGDTRKPFGRIFYTKDKSLLFYAYDLDQQHGITKETAFQAWGRRDDDKKHDISLGLLYQDTANRKRWVLRFHDAKTIAKLDAVFVTVEPEGGSAKPSGKPLLFTYLRLNPNHP